ncbi:MAG: hypothetical protein HQM00_13765 [Magnetococcales bacterium]|nr:hypothetical protein [Magnetococcales bacterium]
MPQRILLCITNHNLVAYPWDHDTFAPPITFDQNRGADDFRAHFAAPGPRCTVYILIDITEEEHKLEQVPRLNALVRTRMLENRSTRILRHSPFRHITPLGRDVGDPSQDSVLFSGLSDPEETVLPWLQLLDTRRGPIAGIWSIPLRTPRRFQGVMKPDQQNVLLLSIHSGGLRQIYLHQGQLRISRLSRLPSQTPEDLVPFLHGEIVRMQGYLASQRMYNWNTELHVYILCNAGMFALLNDGPKGVAGYHLHPVDASRLAVSSALRCDLTSHRMDPLFGQAVRRWAIPNHYARPEDTRIFRTLQYGSRLQWAASGLLAISMALAIYLFWEGRELWDEQPALSRHAEEIQQATRLQIDPRSPQEGRRILTTVQWAELLESHASDPRHAFRILGRVLANHDRMVIEQLEWNVGATGSATAEAGSRAGAKAGSPPKPTAPAGAQILQISGRVEPFSSLKEAMEIMDPFLQELRALPEFMDVQPLQLPLNLGHHQMIEGGDQENPNRASFRIRIMLSGRNKP